MCLPRSLPGGGRCGAASSAPLRLIHGWVTRLRAAGPRHHSGVGCVQAATTKERASEGTEPPTGKITSPSRMRLSTTASLPPKRARRANMFVHPETARVP